MSGQEMGMVTARLDLHFEGLRAAVAEFLATRQETVQAMVSQELETILASGEVERLIKDQITKSLREELKSSIQTGVRHAFWDKESKDKLSALILQGMKEGG